MEVAREKRIITYKEAFIRLSVDFLTETLQARREWHDTFKVIKKPSTKKRKKKQKTTINQENCIQQNYASKMQGKEKLRKFIITRPALIRNAKGSPSR